MIKVYDALMGSGKTTKMINKIKESSLSSKFIYVTPLLSECHRIAGTEPIDYGVNDSPVCDEYGNHIYDNKHMLYNRMFKHPKNNNNKGSKLLNLKNMVTYGENIVTTHALFRSLDEDVLNILKFNNYTLIIDEVLTVFEIYTGFVESELKSLFEQKVLYVDSDGVTLRWDGSKFSAKNTKYDVEQSLCDAGSLLYISGKVVLWELPPVVLKAFSEVWVCTYMFEGSYMKGYLDFHGVPYEVEKFGKSPKDFKELIKIEEGKINDVGESKTAMSFSMQTTNKAKCEQLRRGLNTFYKRYGESEVKDRLWTCFKVSKEKVKGKGYTNQWLSKSTKATNRYSNCWVLAYTCNIFFNPMISRYLSMRGVKIEEDRYALSEMLQWIWRSRIRNNEPIVVYIPSSRMRKLLREWLEEDS